jgi:hypothetical protein
VGPQNVANAAQLWFGGVTADFYEIVHEGVCRRRTDATGWAITATTADKLGIYNPGAGSVTYRIWLIFRTA